MASVVLGIVGNTLLPGVGGAIGALVGGYIDQNFLLPALFPSQTIEGPRVNELKIQSSDEGAYANFLIGGQARVAGTIIWVSDISEVITEEEHGGGKGGGAPSQTVSTSTWFVDIAIAVAMQSGVTIKKIYCEGKLLYNSSPNTSVSSALLSVSLLGSSSKRRMKISSPSTGPDMTQLVVGYDAVVAGWSTGANNGTFKVVSTSRNRSDGSSYAVLKNTACAIEAAGPTVTISQTIPAFDPAKVQDLTFYSGSAAQTPDPLITSYEGAANTPGFSGTAYVVLHGLALTDYGNRVPQMAILADVGGATVALAVTACWTRSGRSAGEVDVTGLSGSMDGYATTGPFAPLNALQPIALAYDVLAQEASGSIRFFHRKNAQIVEVDEVDLVAHEPGDDAARPFEIEEDPPSESPSEANVKHVDLQAENQSGSQRERRIQYGSDGTINVDLPLAMTGARARGIARRLLWTAWANRKRFKLQLPPTYLHVQENDCLRLKALGSSWLMLVQKIDFGANNVLQIEAVLENRDVLTQVEEADTPYTGTTSLASQADDSETQISEYPPHTPSAGTPADAPALTTACIIEDPNIPFAGCQIYRSNDDSIYRLWDTLTAQATLGYAVSALSGTGISTAYWDRISTVDVYVFNGTLTSLGEADVLNGANRAVLGTEIIGFMTATLIATNTYRLSDLLRGLRDTADQIATHAIAENFALFSPAVFTKTFPLSWIGSTKYFRFVFASQSVADADTKVVPITGATLKPFAPASLGLDKNSAGAVTATITRCTRALVSVFAAATVPLWEESEKYEIDVVYPAGSGTIKRTITATGTNVFAYTDPNQTTDGVTPFDPVEYRVYQISAIVGRGKSLVFTG